jgi:hypothetical protein
MIFEKCPKSAKNRSRGYPPKVCYLPKMPKMEKGDFTLQPRRALDPQKGPLLGDVEGFLRFSILRGRFWAN